MKESSVKTWVMVLISLVFAVVFLLIYSVVGLEILVVGPIALLVFGALLGFLQPKKFWLWPILMTAGFIIYAIIDKLKSIIIYSRGLDLLEFFPDSFVPLIIITIITLIGSAIGMAIRKLMTEKSGKN